MVLRRTSSRTDTTPWATRVSVPAQESWTSHFVPAHGRRAVRAAGAERAVPAAPQAARLRLLRRRRPPTLRAWRQPLVECQIGRGLGLRQPEEPVVEDRALSLAAGLLQRGQLHGPVAGVERRADRHVLSAPKVDERVGPGQPDL